MKKATPSQKPTNPAQTPTTSKGTKTVDTRSKYGVKDRILKRSEKDSTYMEKGYREMMKCAETDGLAAKHPIIKLKILDNDEINEMTLNQKLAEVLKGFRKLDTFFCLSIYIIIYNIKV